jgi:AmiR/NasT family two-component response regulator
MSARLLVIEPDVLKQSKIEAMLANYHAKSVIFCVSYLKLTVDLEELNPDVVLISYNCGCLIQDVISAVREKSYAAIIVLAPELCADEKALILNAGADALINMEKVTKDYLVALIKRFLFAWNRLNSWKALLAMFTKTGNCREKSGRLFLLKVKR